MSEIRPETPEDRDGVWHANQAAFGRDDEANLVDRLREQAPGYIGLVAVEDGAIVGHIAFTPVTLAPPRIDADVSGLAPMAVLPEHQRAGVGTALVLAGLAACRAEGVGAVVVLGHPGYYPHFGFAPGAERGITSTYEAPPEAFMVLELTPGALDGVQGVVHYHAAFEG
jgi:putative acetyltransferase